MEILTLLPFPLILVFSFLYGVFIGSFLNVLSDRLPREETILGRSYCESCKHQLSSKDLIPVFSFLALKGKCRYCNVKLSWMYPFSEILAGFFFTLTSYLFITFVSSSLSLLLVYQAIAACLLVIILADFKYHIIPDEMQIALIILALLKVALTSFTLQAFGYVLLAGVMIMLPILLLFLGTQGRGMGFGDVKFAFVMGMLLGIVQGFIALYIAFVTGALIGTILIILKKTKMKAHIAFGPFLVLGVYLMLFFGQQISAYVKSLYGF